MKWIVCLALVAGSVFVSSTALAQRKKRAPRVIELGEQVIKGQIQKPEAFYILQRSELNFQGLEPKKSFIPLILKSVEKAPF